MRAEFSAPLSAKFRYSLGSACLDLAKLGDFWPSTPLESGAALALRACEHHVFRAAVLSIVLTLTGGQNAALLCGVWCQPYEVVPSGCHHQDPTTSPRLSGSDNCNNVVLSVAAFVLQDLRRAYAPDAHYVIVFSRFAPTATGTRSPYEPRPQPALDQRPLVITLRT